MVKPLWMKSIASRWWPDRLRIALCPDRVIVTRLAGLRARIVDKRIVQCVAAPDAQSWAAPLAVLPDVLRESGAGIRSATVILSNHVVRYTVVPWRDSVTNYAERLVLARHCFRSIYGRSVDDWEIRLSGDGFRRNALAAAIDRGLVAALHLQFSQSGIALDAIQPYFMAVSNQFRRVLAARRSACFTVVEQGRATVGIYDRLGWRLLCGRRLMDDRPETLCNVMSQEIQSNDTQGSCDNLLMAALENPRMEVSIGDRVVRSLQLKAQQGFSPFDDAGYAMAYCGAT